MTSVIGMLVGFSFYPGAIRRASRLNIGDPVIIEREPHNPYDSNAIRVLNVNGKMLGHIDWRTAAHLSANIDRGILYTANVCTQPVVGRKPPNLVGIKRGSVLIKCIPLPPLMKTKERIEHEPA